MSKLNKEIIEIFHRDKTWKFQTTRDNVSRFKIKYCSNCTQNAAAYILGLAIGVKIWRKLKKEDKNSLNGYNIPEIVKEYQGKINKRSNFKNTPIKNKEPHKIIKKAVSKLKKRTFPVINTNYPSFIEEMTGAYSWLYITENALRNFIRQILGDTFSWWKTNSPSGVQSAVQTEIQKAPYDSAKRGDELEFTHLGQLKDIILFGKNWNLFKNSLKEQDKEKFRVTIEKAIPTRNSIGHCIPLKGIDRKEVEVRFNDILKMMP